MKKYVRFDRDMSSIVKGIAIIFMLILHGYSHYKYDVPLSFEYANIPAHAGFNICVGMYAFMIGFGYAFSQTKDLRYGWNHIKKLMIPYLIIFLVFILPTCHHEFFSSGWKMMLYTLMGMDTKFYYYNWFIYVFVCAMLVMPAFARFIEKKPLLNSAISVIVLYIINVIAHFCLYPYSPIHLNRMIVNCLTLTPIILLGYLFAHEHYYEKIRIDHLSKPLVLIASVVTLCTMIYLDSILRVGFGIVFEFFYAPVAIGAIAVLFSRLEFKYLRRVMVKLGWASMYMWFLQALVHTPIVRTVYQPVITIFSDVNLVVIWTIVVLFFAAWLLRSAIDYLMGVKGKL